MVTIKEIQRERLKQYLDCEAAIMTGQSYTIGNRTLTRANISAVRKAIDDLLAAGVTLEDEPIKSGYRRAIFIE